MFYNNNNNNNNNNTIVSIEGNIGSGKSTLLEKLKLHFNDKPNIIFLKEPVDDWSTIRDINNKTMLELFYEDQNKYAFAFQMMAYISRLAILKEALQNNSNCIIITERSLYTDKMVFAKMLFDNNNISLENYSIYMKWFDTFVDCFKIDKIVYVKTDPEICYNRIKTRSRTGESNIELDYLQKCHLYHENMLDISLDSCVCKNKFIVNGNIDIYYNINQVTEWIHDIEAFIYNKNTDYISPIDTNIITIENNNINKNIQEFIYY